MSVMLKLFLLSVTAPSLWVPVLLMSGKSRRAAFFSCADDGDMAMSMTKPATQMTNRFRRKDCFVVTGED